MAVTLAVTVASSMVSAVNSAINAGAAAGTLKVYTGGKPANVETAASGTLLATFTLTDPAGTVATNVLTLDFDPDLSATIAATGTAGWFRVADSDGTGVLDGTVGTSSADLIFDSVAFVSGGTVNLATGTVTQPTS